jgi:hypothetical protein
MKGCAEMFKRRYITLGLLLSISYCALFAVTASGTEFLLAQWLVAGSPLAAELPSLIEGELVTRSIIFGYSIDCSLHAEGKLLPESQLATLEVLTLSGVATGTPLSGQAILCKAVAGCENSATDVEWWPTGLPWKLEVELEAPSERFVLLFELGFEMKCLVLGLATSEECSWGPGTGSMELVNVAGGVEAKGTSTPLGNCTAGGTESAELEFVAGNLLSSAEGAVSVSL